MTTMDTEAIWKAWPKPHRDRQFAPERCDGLRMETNGAAALLVTDPGEPTANAVRASACLAFVAAAESRGFAPMDAGAAIACIDAALARSGPCDVCDGKGMRPCSSCYGSGKRECSCEHCTFTHPCHNCDGNKTCDCYRCDEGRTLPPFVRVADDLYEPAPLRAALAALALTGAVEFAPGSRKTKPPVPLVLRGTGGTYVQMPVHDGTPGPSRGSVDVVIGGA